MAGGPSFALTSSVSTLSIKAASSTSATVTVSLKTGFSASVSLAVTGLPAGVTAVFSPAATTTTSTVTLTASSSAPAGIYPLTISGTSGTLTSTTTINLTVVAPSFGLATSATGLTIPEAGSGSSTISVSGINGFAGSVSFAATGLPRGVTASFSPSTATTTAPSKVTFNVGASVPAGTYPMAITGISGTLSSTISISLTVVAPSFSLAASPTSLIIPHAGSGSSTITVSGTNGFAGSVSLSATGMPVGVTASFSPVTATTAASSKVTFNVGASAPAGTYSLTITGISGKISNSTIIELTITALTLKLSFQPGSLEVAGGFAAGGAATIAAKGFNGNVSLAASGLPNGIMASFGSLSVAGTSQIAFFREHLGFLPTSSASSDF